MIEPPFCQQPRLPNGLAQQQRWGWRNSTNNRTTSGKALLTERRSRCSLEPRTLRQGQPSWPD